MDKSTIAYYDAHAEEYAAKTRYVYMFDTRSLFPYNENNDFPPGSALCRRRRKRESVCEHRPRHN